jgi:hypothetical protein
MDKIVLPASHPFEGIAAKLNRSNENINNLQLEIARFFDDSEYPLLSDKDGKVVREALDYHESRPIPPRFSVLAGEIIHHLRSCLDHIVWHFSDTTYREKRGNISFIGFPILKEPPTPTNVFTKYERKIKGIRNPRVLALIKQLQPYGRPDPLDSLLLAIHNLDIIDKHRELVIVLSYGAIKFPINVWQRYADYRSGVPGTSPVDLADELQKNAEIVPQIAFSEFRRGEPEIVIQGLGEMHNHVIKVVEAFDGFL